jgi:hypothetical protein
MPSKSVVLVIVSFLLVTLIYSSVTKFNVFALKKYVGEIACFPKGALYLSEATQVTCCQNTYYQDGLVIRYCTDCDNTQPPSNCGPRYEANRGGVNPPGLPTPAGGATNALPPSGNNSGTPGTSIFNPVRNATNAVPSSNGTSTPPPGSIIKVPVNHTNALPTSNNTGTTPPSLKLSQPSLAGQQTQTQQTTGHHHKVSNTGASTSGGNSTGH